VAGYWRAMALPYHETMAALGGDWFVRKATIEYAASARYEDLLAVGIRCSRIGNRSMVMAAAVFRGEQCLVHGELVYVFADPRSQTSKPVPPELREWLTGFEAGDAATDLRTGHWTALGNAVRGLRQAACAKAVADGAECVADPQDDAAFHAVAFNRAGSPLAAGRLELAPDGSGRIGCLVTLASMRGAGLGRQVLDALIAASRRRGDRELRLRVGVSSVDFYARAGFRPGAAPAGSAGTDQVDLCLAP
jgi:YbgC/YbaW family acyl-CoA thioester hydrolase